MIVVDTSVVAYRSIPGGKYAVAERVFERDPDWHVPLLWRSEFRNVLCGHLRRRALTLEAAQEIRANVEAMLAAGEHEVLGSIVLGFVARTSLSAYDCEYVALAEMLAVPLVTEDRRILSEYAGAISMEAFLAAGSSVHNPRGVYRMPGIAAPQASRRRLKFAA